MLQHGLKTNPKMCEQFLTIWPDFRPPSMSNVLCPNFLSHIHHSSDKLEVKTTLQWPKEKKKTQRLQTHIQSIQMWVGWYFHDIAVTLAKKNSLEKKFF